MEAIHVVKMFKKITIKQFCFYIQSDVLVELVEIFI
jgi:hypothetical protein